MNSPNFEARADFIVTSIFNCKPNSSLSEHKVALTGFIKRALKAAYEEGLAEADRVVSDADPLEAKGSFWEYDQADDIAFGVHRYLIGLIRAKIEEGK